MPRRKREIAKRCIGADPVYRSEVVQKFINVIMIGELKIANSCLMT